MGSETCRAVEADDELELVARSRPRRLARGSRRGGAEVAVDFTTPDAVKDNVRFCLEHGIHVVVGATGLSDEDISEIEQRAARSTAAQLSSSLPTSPSGAVLMMQFAAEAAPYFDMAEIIERHHEKQAGAPSGTALRTAELMNESAAASRGRPLRGRRDPRGQPVAERCPAIRIHSMRDPRLGRAPRGHPRARRRDADDPPRLARSRFVHARRAAGGEEGVAARRPDRRPRASCSIYCDW